MKKRKKEKKKKIHEWRIRMDASSAACFMQFRD